MAQWSFTGARSITVYETASALAEQLALRISQLAAEAIHTRGQFHLVLTGGTTPQLCYQALVSMPIDWSRVYLYMVDERCLPKNCDGRNDLMAAQALIDHIAIPQSHVVMMPAELGPVVGAQAYQSMLEAVPIFDLVLLGMGEDGHTASLFPEHETLLSQEKVLPVFSSPKPPSERISLSLPYINAARQKWFMVTGAGKQIALKQIQEGVRLPAAQVIDAEWYLDSAAAEY